MRILYLFILINCAFAKISFKDVNEDIAKHKVYEDAILNYLFNSKDYKCTTIKTKNTDLSGNEINADVYKNTDECAAKDLIENEDNIVENKDHVGNELNVENKAHVENEDNVENKAHVGNELNVENEDNVENKVEHKIDNGTALILTPLIEAGLLDEARNKSKVTSDIFMGVESYTGFLTVNKTYNSNLFFWYFPVQETSVDESPWLIWLQGGPGASSMTGLFDEIGPFKVDIYGDLIKNPYTWVRNHSIVFIDNPVGTGYSFTDNKLGYAKDMETYSQHLYLAVEQFLKLFPELRSVPLYVAGESYAGKYVPCLAMELHKHKTSSALDINLQGIIVGNGYVEPSMIGNIPRSFYNLGIIQKEQLEQLRPLHESLLKDIDAGRSIEAKEKWTNLILILLSLSHQNHAYNFLKDDLQLGYYATYFLGRSDVKRAIHVGDIGFHLINVTVNVLLAPDFLSSTQSLYENLLENYRILLYCGQLDQMLPCVTTSESHRRWRWSRSDDFNKAIRHPFMYNDSLAGYHKSGGGFTEAIIRGAGHMAPMDSPGSTRSLVTSWTHHKPLNKDPSILLLQLFLQAYLNNTSAVYL